VKECEKENVAKVKKEDGGEGGKRKKRMSREVSRVERTEMGKKKAEKMFVVFQWTVENEKKKN